MNPAERPRLLPFLLLQPAFPLDECLHLEELSASGVLLQSLMPSSSSSGVGGSPSLSLEGPERVYAVRCLYGSPGDVSLWSSVIQGGGRDVCSHVFLFSPQAPLQPPPGSSAAASASGTPQSLKLTYPETLDRIKEEFQFLQTQYHRYTAPSPNPRAISFGPSAGTRNTSSNPGAGVP